MTAPGALQDASIDNKTCPVTDSALDANPLSVHRADAGNPPPAKQQEAPVTRPPPSKAPRSQPQGTPRPTPPREGQSPPSRAARNHPVAPPRVCRPSASRRRVASTTSPRKPLAPESPQLRVNRCTARPHSAWFLLYSQPLPHVLRSITRPLLFWCGWGDSPRRKLPVSVAPPPSPGGLGGCRPRSANRSVAATIAPYSALRPRFRGGTTPSLPSRAGAGSGGRLAPLCPAAPPPLPPRSAPRSWSAQASLRSPPLGWPQKVRVRRGQTPQPRAVVNRSYQSAVPVTAPAPVCKSAPFGGFEKSV